MTNEEHNAEFVRSFKTKVNALRCTRLWLWMESRLGREVLGHYMKSKSERLNDGCQEGS